MKSSEFSRRRARLMRMMGRGSIAILPAAEVRYRTGDSEYLFRQQSDFYYLTGFAEPAAIAVLMPQRPEGEFVMFCRGRDPARERWDGSRAGLDGAVKRFGADEAFSIGEIDDVLPRLIEGRARVFYTMGVHQEFDRRLATWVNGLRAQAKNGLHSPREYVGLDHLVHELRLRKSGPELDRMRAGAKITMAAHLRGMRYAAPGRMEYQLAAEILHEFHHSGAVPSYSPIVGSGDNACILHYRENSGALREGDLVLVDAGCEYDYYASDVTRTYPVGGRFSSEQRAVYEVVLDAQQAAIDQCRAGNPWSAPHEAAVRAITRGLVEIGILRGRVPALIRKQAYREFFMHKTGHWLGMDVHDVGEYKTGNRWRSLEPGMVCTVEPGLYLARGAKSVPKAMQGIGIRIEDDVAVTDGDPEVLTGDLVKQPDELEEFIQLS